MSSSEPELHLATPQAIFTALERAVEEAVGAARAFVRSLDRPEALPERRAAATEARERLAELLERCAPDPVLGAPGQALLDRLHEGALELELAWALGPQDSRGREARARAELAVERDARALSRAFSCFLAEERAAEERAGPGTDDD